MWEDELKKKVFVLPRKTKFAGIDAILLSDTVDIFKALLKEQREICADEFAGDSDPNEYHQVIRLRLLNAPEPTGEK